MKKVYKGEAQKSIVSIIFTGKKPFSRKNRFKLSAMSQALEFNSEIFVKIKAVFIMCTFPIASKDSHEEYQITINFGCDPARVDELVAEVMKQIDTITSQPIEPTYVERVQKIGKNEWKHN